MATKNVVEMFCKYDYITNLIDYRISDDRIGRNLKVTGTASSPYGTVFRVNELNEKRRELRKGLVVGPTILLQRVAANAPLHYSPTLVITRQRTRRPHVARAPAAAAVVRVTRTHLRVIEFVNRVVKLAQPELVVSGGGVLHWRRRGCVRRREEMAEGVGVGA